MNSPEVVASQAASLEELSAEGAEIRTQLKDAETASSSFVRPQDVEVQNVEHLNELSGRLGLGHISAA